MTKREQMQAQAEQGDFAERWFSRRLSEWNTEVVSSFTIAQTEPTQEQRQELRSLLRRGYDAISKHVLGYDYREYKQDDPFLLTMGAIAVTLYTLNRKRADDSEREISGTVATYMTLATALALLEETVIEPEDIRRYARVDLGGRLRRHKLTIAVTEGTWAVQTNWHTAITEIDDPLYDSINEIARLIESGDINAAARLARRVNRLARLPHSVAQGKVLRYVNDARDRLVEPLAQSEIVARLRMFAADRGVREKTWLSVGDGKVRPSHQAAHGQKREEDEPFELAGGRMQYPGDGSLGASLGEIINCRCETFWE